MTEPTLAPIELNDDELLAVSGGSASAHASAAIVQKIGQFVGVAQIGGNLSVGGNGSAAPGSAELTFNNTRPACRFDFHT
jgi:hypothetical protein